MTAKRQRGRKWAMLEAVATAMLHGWKVLMSANDGYVLFHRGTERLVAIDLDGRQAFRHSDLCLCRLCYKRGGN